jgi:hypothetical protein
MLLPYERYSNTVRAGLRSGYTIEFINDTMTSYQRLSVDKEAKVVSVINQHKQNIDSLQMLISNKAKYEREGRIFRVIDGVASKEDLIALGLTPDRLGSDGFSIFLDKVANQTLTNQYLKSILLSESVSEEVILFETGLLVLPHPIHSNLFDTNDDGVFYKGGTFYKGDTVRFTFRESDVILQSTEEHDSSSSLISKKSFEDELRKHIIPAESETH